MSIKFKSKMESVHTVFTQSIDRVEQLSVRFKRLYEGVQRLERHYGLSSPHNTPPALANFLSLIADEIDDLSRDAVTNFDDILKVLEELIEVLEELKRSHDGSSSNT